MIPKSFCLVNRTWKVKIVTTKQLQKHLDLDWHNDKDPLEAQHLKGLCDPHINVIFLNKELHKTEGDLEHTFWHEFVHALWFAEGYEANMHDETQVDRIGGMLAQFERSKRC